MWKCVFKTDTGIGSGFNRDPFENEFAVDLSPSICAWFSVYPSRYKYVDNVFSERTEWPAEEAAAEAAQQQEIEELQARVAALEAAQEDSGVHKYTPQKITNYITSAIDGAGTVAQVKEVVKQLLIKMAVYILK